MEVAGLVLGAFPLVLGGIKFYTAESGTIRTIYRPKQALKRLFQSIRTEYAKFRNTIENLLEDLVDQDQLASLIAGNGWHDTAFKEKLRLRISKPYLIKSFLEGVAAIHEDLEHLIKDLNLDTKMKGKGKASADRWKEIKIVLSLNDYKDTINNIDKCNRDLVQLTSSVSVQQVKQIRKVPKYLSSIRMHAINLHNILRTKLSAPNCNCAVSHTVNLQLETFSSLLRCGISKSPDLKFRVIFPMDQKYSTNSKPRFWVEWQFEPQQMPPPLTKQHTLEMPFSPDPEVSSVRQSPDESKFWQGFSKKLNSVWSGFWSREDEDPNLERSKSPGGCSKSKPKPKPMDKKPEPPQKSVAFDLPLTRKSTNNSLKISSKSQIQDLCAWIKLDTLEKLEAREGVLQEPDYGEYVISTVGSSFTVSCSTSTVFLTDLLAPDRMPLLDRLNIGVQLAAGVMQLYETEWLNTVWGTEDVLFLLENRQLQIQGGDYVNVFEPVLSRPLIGKRLHPGNHSTTSTMKQDVAKASSVTNYNPTILCLGFVLAELALETRFDRNEHTTSQICSKYQEIYIKPGFGHEYATAVMTTICGLGAQFTNLGHQGFKDEFFNKVYEPLEKNLIRIKDEQS